ncbi:protein SRC2-like [Aristolochia californica]|uniref:protein SRC2-like n=1 Tax=Aristolochia californica TaxID=171875 RepID=UPI0035E0B213
MSPTKYVLQPIQKPEARLREIEVLIISAQDLKNVKHLTRVRAYAVVYVDHDMVSKTSVDREGGVNPVWNERLTVRFRERPSPEEDVLTALNVDIYAHGHLREKPIGSARVLLCDVLGEGSVEEPADNPIQCLTLQVWRPSGRPQGFLNLWVPPTGKFLRRRDSLSFGVRDEVMEEKGQDDEKEKEQEQAEAEAEADVLDDDKKNLPFLCHQ